MATLPLLRGGTISLQRAMDDDENILHRLNYPQRKEELWAYLLDHRNEIEAAVSFHLRVKNCQVAESVDWMCGSYNVCIPVYLNPPSEERVLFRVPMPFKIGEDKYPGNIEEKLRCEVATYIWMRDNCPDVPIPDLYGFAFPNGQTACELLPFICIGS
jgi:hypothetical protein